MAAAAAVFHTILLVGSYIVAGAAAAGSGAAAAAAGPVSRCHVPMAALDFSKSVPVSRLALLGLKMHSSCWKDAGMEDPPLPRLRNVFVYGSLLAPEVVSALIDRVPRSSPAYVTDYHRYSIKGRLYPAAIPVPDHKVTGKVLFDLTDQELALLDEFEDIEYTKEIVEPVLMGSGKEIATGPSSPLQASIYVWANLKDENLQGEWSYEEFRDKYLEEYVKMCEDFVNDYYKAE